jgi:hypothetical protein
MTALASVSTPSALESKTSEPVRPTNAEKTKKILIITAIALAAIALFGAVITLTILFPHMSLVPLITAAIGFPIIVSTLFAWAFGRSGH